VDAGDVEITPTDALDEYEIFVDVGVVTSLLLSPVSYTCTLFSDGPADTNPLVTASVTGVYVGTPIPMSLTAAVALAGPADIRVTCSSLTLAASIVAGKIVVLKVS
jgi:hypothetical protein